MYRYGGALAVIIFFASLILMVLSVFINKLKSVRRDLLYIIIVMATAQFLIVEVSKNTMGRPRPGEITQFGGKHEYVQPMIPNPALFGDPDDGKSFPSSHVSAAFLPVILFFVFIRRRINTLAYTFLCLASTNGILMCA